MSFARVRKKAVIISSGRGVYEALAAADECARRGIATGVVDMPSIDEELLLRLHDSGKVLVFAEQNNGYLWQNLLKVLCHRKKSNQCVDRIVSVNTRTAEGKPRFILGTYENCCPHSTGSGSVGRFLLAGTDGPWRRGRLRCPIRAGGDGPWKCRRASPSPSLPYHRSQISGPAERWPSTRFLAGGETSSVTCLKNAAPSTHLRRVAFVEETLRSPSGVRTNSCPSRPSFTCRRRRMQSCRPRSVPSSRIVPQVSAGIRRAVMPPVVSTTYRNLPCVEANLW